ncbi:hypothetical protein B296_00006285, partial [Ensete ventricosum]
VAVFSSDPVIALGVVDAMAMAIPIPHRQLFIDGEWSEPLRGKRLPIINPATEESIGRSTVEDVELAVAAARKALTRNKGKDWARAPGAVRAKYLRAIAAKLFIRTCLELAQVCKEVALPPGVLNVVTGLGPEAGGSLASHPHVDKVQLDLHLIDLVMQVAFTGSTETGKKIMTSAAQMVKVCLFCYGLAGAVISKDTERCQRISEVSVCGFGRELGEWGLDNYLSVKQVTEYISDDPWGWYPSPSKL